MRSLASARGLVWGGFGTGAGQFNFPAGVAVDAGGNVFVVDRFNNRMQKFTNDGDFLTKGAARDRPTGNASAMGIDVDVFVVDDGDTTAGFRDVLGSFV